MRTDGLKLLRQVLREDKKENKFEKIAYYSEWVRWFLKGIRKTHHTFLLRYVDLVILMGECNRDHGWDACKAYIRKFLAREKRDLKKHGDDISRLRSSSEYDMTIFAKTVMLHSRTSRTSSTPSGKKDGQAQKSYAASGSCFRCRGAGHFVKDCPNPKGSTAQASTPVNSTGSQTGRSGGGGGSSASAPRSG